MTKIAVFSSEETRRFRRNVDAAILNGTPRIKEKLMLVKNVLFPLQQHFFPQKQKTYYQRKSFFHERATNGDIKFTGIWLKWCMMEENRHFVEQHWGHFTGLSIISTGWKINSGPTEFMRCFLFYLGGEGGLWIVPHDKLNKHTASPPVCFETRVLAQPPMSACDYAVQTTLNPKWGRIPAPQRARLRDKSDFPAVLCFGKQWQRVGVGG